MTIANAVKAEVGCINLVSDGKWVAEVEATSFMKAHEEDHRTPRTDRPLIVPVRHWAQVIGVRADKVSMSLVHESETGPEKYGYVSIEQKWKLVTDKPFVVVHFRDHDEWGGDFAKLRRDITTARQIHKGELGRKPDLTKKPRIFSSEIPDSDNGYWASSGRYDEGKYIVPKLNWVRLSELAKIVGISEEEIIRGFAGFSSSSYYELNVPILCGTREEDIVRVYMGAIPENFCIGEQKLGGEKVLSVDSLHELICENPVALVPQSFAYTVIRLVQFGYRPKNEAPENSFRLVAPMPTPPEVKLPVLSVEELRKLHELRAEIPEELPKERFRQIAEIALDTVQWRRVRNMGDTSPGFSYYVEFDSLEAFDGRLVISTCFWTRAGASKSENYYAGFLAVFPKRVEDPRRDPSAILRIWFWPRELVRQNPAGSVGGLCPPEVPADLGERVKIFLKWLGYAI